MDGSKIDRLLLTQKYLTINPGLRIFIRDDLLPDRFILNKWRLGLILEKPLNDG